MASQSATPASAVNQMLAEAQRCLGTSDNAGGAAAAAEAFAAARAAGDWTSATQAAVLRMTHLHRSGAAEQAVALGEQVLADPGLEIDAASRTELLGALALSTDLLDLLAEALEHALAALESARRSGDEALLCLALSRVARAHRRLNNPARGREFGEQSLALARRIGSVDQEFRALNCLIDVQVEQGDQLAEAGAPEAARPYYEQAVAASRLALDVAAGEDIAYRSTVAWFNNAFSLQRLGQSPQALASLDRAQALAAEHGFDMLLRAQVELRCTILSALGHAGEARRLAEAALAEPETAASLTLAPALHERAYEACKAQADLAAALQHHEQLLRLQKRQFRERNDLHLRVLLARAELQRSRHLAEQSAHEAQAAREHAQQLQVERDHLAQQARDLGRHALTDALTGLHNRRAIEPLLYRAALRSAGACCVAMIDVDHFKQVNDRHGHVLGDTVLRRLAGLLAQGLREHDDVARWGGEEFIALLHDMSAQEALAACERLRMAVAGHDWARVAQGLAVTISLGVYPLRAGDTPVQAVARADRALYAAKRGGRNRVVLGAGADDECLVSPRVQRADDAHTRGGLRQHPQRDGGATVSSNELPAPDQAR